MSTTISSFMPPAFFENLLPYLRVLFLSLVLHDSPGQKALPPEATVPCVDCLVWYCAGKVEEQGREGLPGERGEMETCLQLSGVVLQQKGRKLL